MYKVHQNAKMVPATLTTEDNQGVPLINASASVDSGGKLHISMCNTHISDAQSVAITLNNAPAYISCTATIINGPAYNSYNDYNGVEPVNIQPFSEKNFSQRRDAATTAMNISCHPVRILLVA